MEQAAENRDFADWNPGQYLLFEKERNRPALDLIRSLGNIRPRRILDLGCGPGNSTALLARRFPEARITGTDHSPAMIRRAHADHPELDFRLADAVTEELEREFDLIFSNAALQWMPDHPSLIRKWRAGLRPGGVLAVQLPDTFRHPIHTILQDIFRSVPRFYWLAEVRTFHTLEPEEYFRLLDGFDGSFDLWTTTYYQRAADASAILDWYKGARLRPYLDRLDVTDRTEFLARILDELRRAYPSDGEKPIPFPVPRIFFTVKVP